MVECRVWARVYRQGNVVQRMPQDDQSPSQYQKYELSPSMAVKKSRTLVKICLTTCQNAEAPRTDGYTEYTDKTFNIDFQEDVNQRINRQEETLKL